MAGCCDNGEEDEPMTARTSVTRAAALLPGLLLAGGARTWKVELGGGRS
jgi:hypothetical protein